MITYKDKRIPPRKWVSERLWSKFIQTMPIASIDIIFERKDQRILFGYRVIEPYSNIWALIGGRLLRNESIMKAAMRISDEYGLAFDDLFLVGIYCSNFRSRSTVTISVAARNTREEDLRTAGEFTKFAWMIKEPRNLGHAYRLMLSKWKLQKKSEEILAFNKILDRP